VLSRPVCELCYYSAGTLTVGVGKTVGGGDEVFTVVGSVSVGTVRVCNCV
jgi:hypothetical protein